MLNVEKGVKGFIPKPLRQRFDEKFVVDTTTGCWAWTGQLRKGYGCLKSGGDRRAAHRVSWELFRGPVPEGMWVLHKCDNPKCVNPEHLFVGSALDNNVDMVRKGRARLINDGNWQPGERHRLAKLTEAQARDIKSEAKTRIEYARLYGVNPSTVKNIQTGQNWGHLGLVT